ncbi:MAG: ComEC/Rec2 family competence protein [Rickettsiales bacterium]|nr:ComEC/Rec2 family competence protein [Rickettsiales bacterium]
MGLSGVLGKLKEQFYEDKSSHILWLPVFFTIGVFLRFNSCIAPALVLFLFLVSLISTVAQRDSNLGIIFIIFTFFFLGFLRADRHIARYDFPMVKYNLGRVLIYGDIENEVVSITKDGRRLKYIIVSVDRIEAINKNSAFARDGNFKPPRKVRIRLQNPEEEVALGSALVEANLIPIESKKFSSDFDLQMYFYFKKIGATGYGGLVGKRTDSSDGQRKMTIGQAISRFRINMAMRIMSVRKGLSTNMIATILTGHRGLVDKHLMKLINNLGLASTLSISSVHMLILSQIILVILKETLFKSSQLILRFNVYRISALVSLLINSLYYLVSGFSISTTRAYIINVIGLMSIILGRFNSPVRSVMFAMFAMIFVRPDLLFRIGFYMSFISSLVMIAFVDYYYIHGAVDRMYFRSGLLENLKVSFIISLLIEIAVAPLEIYSFNTFSFYKIPAALIINPIITFIVIPAALLSVLLYPLRAEFLLIYPLSYVVDVIVFVIKFFGGLAKSVLYVQSPPIGIVVVIVIGILWISLWTRGWRKFGLLLYLFGILSIVLEKKPDMIVDNIDKIVIFFDEKNRAHAYGSARRRIINIVNRFGKNEYRDLSREKQDSCITAKTVSCSRISVGVNSIEFYKNGRSLSISQGKYFRIGKGESDFTIVSTKNPSRSGPWFNGCKK